MDGSARLISGPVRGRARAIGLMTGRAGLTDTSGARRYLNVWPEEAQQLMWLNPQTGIDYEVSASTNLEWNII